MALRSFDPDALLENWSLEEHVPSCDSHKEKTFEECIRAAFDIPSNDTYLYRAQGETTLAITQKAINGKRAHGLHKWYHDETGNLSDPPHPVPDEITSYITLFIPTPALPKSLTSLSSNAKSHSLRSHIAAHLISRYHNTTSGLLPPKRPRTHKNPYLDLWSSTCHELEWAGPWPNTRLTKQAHHVLPVLYHHFGCVVPSHAALYVIAKLAQPARPSKEAVRPILDVGSGNGYWTFLLRRFPLEGQMKALDVRAVDDGTSEYRVMWVSDTIRQDGAAYLVANGNGRGCVLLLVYPQATGEFTATMLRRFEGDSIVVAGTQNANGFTGFRDCMVDEWVQRELPAFKLTLRMPLPSFAGKDEALFVFQRREA